MGLSTSRIPDRVNREEFRALLTECCPLPGALEPVLVLLPELLQALVLSLVLVLVACEFTYLYPRIC